MVVQIVASYTTGNALGALSSLLLLGLLGAVADLLSPAGPLLVGAVALCAIAIVERLLVGLRWMAPRLPERRRLIGRERLVTDGTRGVRSFGYLMGLGWWVYIPSAAPYCLALLCIAKYPSLGFFGGAWAGFTAGRALPLWLGAVVPSVHRRAKLLAALENLSEVHFASVAGLGVVVLTLWSR